MTPNTDHICLFQLPKMSFKFFLIFNKSKLLPICKPTNQRFATVLYCPRRYLTNTVDYDNQHQHSTVSSKGHRSTCSYFCSWLRPLHIGRGMPSGCILCIQSPPQSCVQARRNAGMLKCTKCKMDNNCTIIHSKHWNSIYDISV